jgi:hypothetical protein
MPEGTTKEGDESFHIHHIVGTVEVCLRCAQEEKEQSTQALKRA